MEYELQEDLEYAQHDGVKLAGDLYTPRGAGTFPIVVGVHGGGWQQGDAKFYRYWGGYLAARGIALYAITYRRAREGRKAYPEAVNDVRAAVQFLRGTAAARGIDPERIALFGDSAGAHLAALVALAGERPPFAGAYPGDAHAGVSTRVKVCVGVYGVYDLASQWQHDLAHRPFDNISQKFLGAALAENRRLYFEASPISYATRDNNATAFLLSWGTHDDVVDPRTQSEAFLLALKQAGYFTRPFPLAGAAHFWNQEPVQEPGSLSGMLAPRLLRFLQERLG